MKYIWLILALTFFIMGLWLVLHRCFGGLCPAEDGLSL